MKPSTPSEQRAREVIAAYGGDPKRWPIDERETVQAQVDASESLQILCRQELGLDQRLSAHTLASTFSTDDVLAALDALPTGSGASLDMPNGAGGEGGSTPDGPILEAPSEGWLERALDWLIPESAADLWRPAVAAMAPVALGVILGSSVFAPQADWSDSEQFVFVPLGEEVMDG